MLKHRIEEATLSAWPATQQMLMDGWVVRFAHGYTGRANSVTPMYAGQMDIDTKIDSCEQFYRWHSIPARFRITTFCPTPELDTALDQRSYRKFSTTLVYHRPLAGWNGNHTPPAITEEPSLERWLDEFYRLSNRSRDDYHLHFAILQNIPTQRYQATLQVEGQVVACGLGVLTQTLFGLFDVVVDPSTRNKGYGTKLVNDMLTWANQQGAQDSYLQVVKENLVAQHVYQKLGYKELYKYWYRISDW